jgi:hypothetical protein
MDEKCQKTNLTVAFKGRASVRSEIVINNNITCISEQINTFSYPGCLIPYQNEKDITVKISKLFQISAIINRNLKHAQVQKHTGLKIYNTLSLRTLLYGCEIWALTEQDKWRIT